MTELWQLSATELAKRVRQRDVSAREVADAVLDRLDAVNPAINAVVEHRPDDVRQQADEVDRAIARGDDPGPLAGVPVTVKINVDQAGFATTNGTRLQRNLVAPADSPVVANIRKAGGCCSAAPIPRRSHCAGSRRISCTATRAIRAMRR